jgi:hypothetical protein
VPFHVVRQVGITKSHVSTDFHASEFPPRPEFSDHAFRYAKDMGRSGPIMKMWGSRLITRIRPTDNRVPHSAITPSSYRCSFWLSQLLLLAMARNEMK